jgi:hypothetical protein
MCFAIDPICLHFFGSKGLNPSEPVQPKYALGPYGRYALEYHCYNYGVDLPGEDSSLSVGGGYPQHHPHSHRRRRPCAITLHKLLCLSTWVVVALRTAAIMSLRRITPTR